MRMTERIDVANLPEFDASQFLDSDEAVAAYLNDFCRPMIRRSWLRPLATLPEPAEWPRLLATQA